MPPPARRPPNFIIPPDSPERFGGPGEGSVAFCRVCAKSGRRSAAAQGGGLGGTKGLMSAVEMESKAWFWENDGVLECFGRAQRRRRFGGARRGKCLWLLRSQTHSLLIRISMGSPASREVSSTKTSRPLNRMVVRFEYSFEFSRSLQLTGRASGLSQENQ